MVTFSATIHRFDSQGEKTGWTYIPIPQDIADKLKPGNRQSFRVKGRLDKLPIQGIALMPMGDGSFIMALNATLRKQLAKGKGAMVKVVLAEDTTPFTLNSDFMECLRDEPAAIAFFESLSPSHQRYFSKWIDDAKTIETKSRRIAQAVEGLAKKMDYGTMIRSNRKNHLPG